MLDVGGGIGIIHHELLRAAVADTATHVDASSSYLEAARSEAQRRGHDGRVRFMHGDFVDLAPELDAADIVTLDRVICCYPDMERLVGLSAGRARRLYGVVYPRDTWWLRLSFPLPNLWFRLRRSGFRVYLHNPTHIDAVIRAQGLEPAFHATTLVWEVAVYKRPTSPSPRPRPSPS